MGKMAHRNYLGLKSEDEGIGGPGKMANRSTWHWKPKALAGREKSRKGWSWVLTKLCSLIVAEEMGTEAYWDQIRSDQSLEFYVLSYW